MESISTGDSLHHEVYGEVELVGFKSVSDEIEINELNRGGEVQLDVVCSVQTDYVEFLDSKGRKYQEPLRKFYSHTKINS